MTRVRCILVETTVPVRIRPRMETSPVKGHFLSRIPCQTTSSKSKAPSRSLRDRTNVCALNRSLRCPEAQPNVLVPSSPTLSDSGALRSLDLLIDEDMRLFLERAFRLYCQLRRHDCGLLSMLKSKLCGRPRTSLKPSGCRADFYP